MARVRSKKYSGVYLNKLTDGDITYSINYKDAENKKTWFTVGKKSNGITETYAYNKRNEFINKIKLGEEPPAVLKRKKKDIVSLDSIALEHYKSKENHNRNNKLSKRKYEMHISPLLGKKDIKSITSEEIQKLQTLKLKEFALKTVNTILGEMSAIFNYAIEKNIATQNPLKKIKSLKVDNIRERYLSKEEIFTLLDHTKLDEQLHIFTLLALTTGARVGAICKITPRDINFVTKTISVLDEKNNEKYIAFLGSQELEELLKIRVKNIKLDTPVLKENEANLYDQIKLKARTILDRLFNDDDIDAKHKVVIHTLRHTFASHLAINGTPIFTIQKLLNHKDIRMTLRYAKLNTDTGRDSILKLGF
ncbi:site-specific integrase [Sulfurimonas sp. CVO]|uniref:tyrosine-type recombinase/integrase n=1 Tax=Sulfurimonas sp. CVO TaxID=2283483 RepID=UPI00132F4B1C|nr:site-specific integrase [Sulfurimonas sp. CVO]QHG90382.1 site-specific integrase [Sulfurimonas sp. CVO]